jgi:hypothetical protein
MGGHDPDLAVLAVDAGVDGGRAVFGGGGPGGHARDGNDDGEGDGGAMDHAAS